MKIKTKLMTAIMSFVLVLGLLSVGVYALNQAEVTLGGNLTFTADGVYAEVTGSVEGAVTNPTYEDLLFSANNTPDQSSWQENTLAFDANGTDIVITINIHNLATDRPLYAKISDTAEKVENVVKSVKKDGADVLDEPFKVTAGQTAVITITFDLQNVNLSLEAESLYGYKLELSKDEIATAPEVLEADLYASVAFDYVSEVDKTIYAYKKGDAVTEVIIPSKVIFNGEECSVVRVGDDTNPGSQKVGFAQWTTLEKVILEDGVESIGNYSFYGCSALTSVTIGNGVTSIGNSAFYNCSKLTSIIIPDSVTSIGASVFSGCSGLTSITIPDSVQTIGGAAFSGCSGLTSVTIPDSVQTISASAFDGCSGLTSITVNATTPPTLGGDSVFTNVPATCPIYVPSGSVDAYKAADGWKDRAGYIQAINA